MPASPRPTRLPYRKAWELLEKHEQERYHLARGIDIPLRPGLSNVQRYSIHNSRKHRNESRYSDVSAYDYTAVKPRGEFLHANVVGDGTGRWWVAAQVRLFQRPQLTRGTARTHPVHVLQSASGQLCV